MPLTRRKLRTALTFQSRGSARGGEDAGLVLEVLRGVFSVAAREARVWQRHSGSGEFHTPQPQGLTMVRLVGFARELLGG
ncbi:hypothetical protein E2C01_077831 [Portunus trituberculatus]|uniref:Uncharacterized protein n=1 Tax=Portunus trituberculatus TaxID=210409 RepID=A0A5B7IQZ3_PORTR|nr:hypothetical protein [Portunus trituberculatus]